jgi:hypothetical protein
VYAVSFRVDVSINHETEIIIVRVFCEKQIILFSRNPFERHLTFSKEVYIHLSRTNDPEIIKYTYNMCENPFSGSGAKEGHIHVYNRVSF